MALCVTISVFAVRLASPHCPSAPCLQVRRPDSSLYATTKRLQEEMCRQFYDADGLPIIVFRPDGIIDLRHGRQRAGAGASRKTVPLLEKPRVGSVCRYDIAYACRAAVLLQDGTADFEILHVATEDVSLPPAERASAFCNVGRCQTLLGVSFEHDLSHFATRQPAGARL
jgi:nucleoside-diphosphate-sugar epimerase